MAALALLGLFLWREATTAHPMLDLRLFRNRTFSVATGGIGLTYLTLFGIGFLLAQFLQLVMALSPLEAGLLQLPVSATMLVISPQVPRLADRHGTHRVILIGLLCVAGGTASLSRLEAESSVWLVVAGLVVLTTGVSITSAPLTTLMMASVRTDRAGSGSAMNNVSRELGGAIGVAILGSVVSARYRSGVASATAALPAASRDEADAGLTGALDVAAQLPEGPGSTLAMAARDAFVDDFALAGALAAALAVLIGAGIAAVLRGARPAEHATKQRVAAAAIRPTRSIKHWRCTR